MKQNQLLTLLAVGVGGYFIYDYWKKTQGQLTPGTPGTPGTPTNGNGATNVIESGSQLIDSLTQLWETAFPDTSQSYHLPTNGTETIAGNQFVKGSRRRKNKWWGANQYVKQSKKKWIG